jgi:hypothetical protein
MTKNTPSRMVDIGLSEIHKTFDLGKEPTEEEIKSIQERIDNPQIIIVSEQE